MESIKDEIIRGNMKWLVGRCLNYIDLGVEPGISDDRYSKKEVLKKLFEEKIYGIRNVMYTMEKNQIIEKMDVIFQGLLEDLMKLIITAISEEDRRENFRDLLMERVEEMKSKLNQDLEYIQRDKHLEE